jgi:hypothetical protein
MRALTISRFAAVAAVAAALAASMLPARADAAPPKDPGPAAGPAVRMVEWRLHPGQDQAFEDGYRRHLGWHRSKDDPWIWHGWMVISGARLGSFIDGTFLHAWSDFDHPVDPAGDGDDNERNVEPHAGELTQASLTAPLLTLVHLQAGPADGAALEAAVARAGGGVAHALLRPIDGSDEYLLLVPAAHASELGAHAAWLRTLVHAIAGEHVRLERVRSETARYRSDLSSAPRR